jgi:CheY-like chemotaxis protein
MTFSKFSSSSKPQGTPSGTSSVARRLAGLNNATPTRGETPSSNKPHATGTTPGAAPGLTPSDSQDEPQVHRVLVVESDIETADLIVALLENAGYSAEVAIDGQYGLLLVDTFEPELILLGLSLPGMSGYDVTQILRTEPRYAQRFRYTRIFYITDKEQMLQKRFHSLPGTPMHDYIFKPIDIPELLDKVARVFGDKAS